MTLWTDPPAPAPERERDVKHAILLHLNQRPTLRLWNHPTGVARALEGGQIIRYGLVGSGDLCGIHAPTGRHVWIETKHPRGGEHRKQQQRFRDFVLSMGGVYVLTRSVDDCERQLAEVL